MSNVVAFSGSNLPAVATLATALKTLDTEVGSTGAVILKMDKTGHWVFGADQTEVEDGSKWAINPYSFVHGYIAWGAGEVLGEKMVSVAEPLPQMPEAPSAAKKGWEAQFGMSLQCVSGEDKGLEVRYCATSVGGKRAVKDIAAAIAEQVEKDSAKPVPVVLLQKDHYTHREYGRIFTPIFKVDSWVPMSGPAAPAAEEEAPATEEEAPRRRRRVAE